MNEQSLRDIDNKYTDEEKLILNSVDKFLEKDVRPYVNEFESEDKYPQDIADKIAKLGLFGATISQEYGGLGLSAVTYSKIVENVSSVWMSVSGIFNSHLIKLGSVIITNSVSLTRFSFFIALIVISEEMPAGSPDVINILFLIKFININFVIDDHIFF